MQPAKTGSICYIVPSWDPDDASHMAHLPRFLSEVGRYCDVHVIVQRGCAELQIPNARSVYIQRARSHFGRAIELVRAAWRLRREGCRKFFVRISPSAAFELGLVGRLLGAQVYYWVSTQGKRLKPAWRRSFTSRLSWEVSEWLMRISIGLSYRFVTGPQAMVDYFAREFGVARQKIILLYNDVDVLKMQETAASVSRTAFQQELGLSPSDKVSLFVGRISPLKGGYHLLPLGGMFKRIDPSLKIIVCGDPYLSEIPRSAQDGGLDNLKFMGAVPNREVPKYMKASQVFLLPSESEGFPRVLLEAMACGLPVVAFDVGGVRDILGPKQQAFVVPRGDLQAFVDRATRLLNDAGLRQTLAEENLQQVQQYSTEQVAQMFVERIVRD